MLRKGKRLGQGSYGILYVATSSDGAETYAFKRNLAQGEGFSEVIRELDILNRLRGHPRIITIKVVSIGSPFLEGDILSPAKGPGNSRYNDDVFHFLFELADSSLSDWLYVNNRSFKQLKQFMVDILLGVEFINVSGIIHRDLKPGNIVVFKPSSDPKGSEAPKGPPGPSEAPKGPPGPSEISSGPLGQKETSSGPTEVETSSDLLEPRIILPYVTPNKSPFDVESPNGPGDFSKLYRAKIIDFGLAKPIVVDGDNTPGVTTAWYRAPEVLGRRPNYTEKIDAWAVGCIFYEMIFLSPFVGKIGAASAEIIKSILRNAHYNYSDYEIKTILGYKGKIKPPPDCRSMFDRLSYSQTIRNMIAVSLIENVPKVNPYEFLPQSSAGTSPVRPVEELIKEIADVLEGLLRIDPEKRLSPTQALNMPLFSSHAAYIQKCREECAPKLSYEYMYNIPKCLERRYVSAYISVIYNERERYYWYSHRRLFHAIDIFDRVLRYKLNKAPANAIEIPDKEKGRALTKLETELYFFTCLFISIKYFSSLQFIIKIEDCIPKHLHQQIYKEKMLTIEIEILRDILSYFIYRHTLYEAVCISIPGENRNTLEDSKKREMVLREGIIKLIEQPPSINGMLPSAVCASLVQEHSNTSSKEKEANR